MCDKICRRCQDVLNTENWQPYKIKRNDRVCKKCYSIERKGRYKKKIPIIKNNKICNECKEIKEFSEFYFDKSQRGNGYSSKCKYCIKQYIQDNRDKINKSKKQYRQNNPQIRVKDALCTRIWGLIKGKWKSKTLYKYLGISYLNFIKWIKYQFNSKMNMKNYGSYWSIDHVIPCSSFNLENNEKLKECFNWSNLRPLEKIKNSYKNSKILPFELLKQEIKAHYFKRYLLDSK